jgi:hypothetical protein
MVRYCVEERSFNYFIYMFEFIGKLVYLLCIDRGSRDDIAV